MDEGLKGWCTALCTTFFHHRHHRLPFHLGPCCPWADTEAFAIHHQLSTTHPSHPFIFHLLGHCVLGQALRPLLFITSCLPSIPFHHHPLLLLEYQLFVRLTTLPAFSTIIFFHPIFSFILLSQLSSPIPWFLFWCRCRRLAWIGHFFSLLAFYCPGCSLNVWFTLIVAP